jgi:hypothetical protein
MEAAGTSEESVNFYWTTKCKIPEDSHLYTRRRESLKFHIKCSRALLSDKSVCVTFQIALLLTFQC